MKDPVRSQAPAGASSHCATIVPASEASRFCSSCCCRRRCCELRRRAMVAGSRWWYPRVLHTHEERGRCSRRPGGLIRRPRPLPARLHTCRAPSLSRPTTNTYNPAAAPRLTPTNTDRRRRRRASAQARPGAATPPTARTTLPHPPTHRPSSHHGLRPGPPCRPAPRLRRQPSRRRQHGVCSGLQADCPGSMVRRQGQWAVRGEPLYRTHKDTLTRARARPPHPPVLPPSHACLPSSHTSLYPIHCSIHASLPPHAPTCAGQLAQPATTRVAAESTDGMGLPRPETML